MARVFERAEVASFAVLVCANLLDPFRVTPVLDRKELAREDSCSRWWALPGRRTTLSIMLGSLSSRMSDSGRGPQLGGA